MLEIFSWMPNRDIHIITKSPTEQYSNSNIKIKEIGEENKALRKGENALIVFDYFLGTSISKSIDQFFIREVIII